MRNKILVAFFISLVTLVSCTNNESKPTEGAMTSMEKPKDKMQQSTDASQDPAAATEAPASADGAGSAQ